MSFNLCTLEKVSHYLSLYYEYLKLPVIKTSPMVLNLQLTTCRSILSPVTRVHLHSLSSLQWILTWNIEQCPVNAQNYHRLFNSRILLLTHVRNTSPHLADIIMNLHRFKFFISVPLTFPETWDGYTLQCCNWDQYIFKYTSDVLTWLTTLDTHSRHCNYLL